MSAPDSIDAELGVEDLRAALLRYTRQAYALLPAMVQPRFLDIGCGSGRATIELARLSGSSVVGIDTDATALAELRRRIEGDRLGHRVEIVNVSLFDVSFADEIFDVLWAEGVLHLLGRTRSLPVCRRLLKPGGFLVMHETVVWFEGIRAHLSADGFGIVNEHLLPKRCWWTDYYAPLEDRIRLLWEVRGREIASGKLAQYEREIAMVKANPDGFDCGFFILQKL
jgi:SAM-dependent methyltransferase